ncbi:hypothetical protein [Leptospira noguchii]|uniref:hypothetical protein n=1 Tax=Leptospira noguchii TaxID=28182 RepID=UPI0003286F33|nr:hypothetical protein [Leptospira noguchii]EMS84705.1 hypothetical protein LEP1GSC073_1778 [Leptospira noguchii str. Cascata]
MKKDELEKRTKAEFSFASDDFFALLKQSEKKCSLTGRTLTALNVEVELREPYKAVGIEEADNHYLVHREVSYLARHVDEDDIIHLAAEIIMYRGAEKRYTIMKSKKGKRK